jgi:hypothetical protein
LSAVIILIFTKTVYLYQITSVNVDGTYQILYNDYRVGNAKPESELRMSGEEEVKVDGSTTVSKTLRSVWESLPRIRLGTIRSAAESRNTSEKKSRSIS